MRTSADAREQALASFRAAKDLLDAEGNVPPEKSAQFEAIMTEAMGFDREFNALQKAEGSTPDRLHERLSFYNEAVTGKPMGFNRTELDPNRAMSLGSQFVASEEYKRLKASGALESDSRHFDTGRVMMSDRRLGAAASDIVQTTSGSATSLVTPEYLPGILPLPQRELTVRGLFGAGQMSGGDTLSYAAQTGFDNGAAAVSQAIAVNGSGVSGGVKPQSSIAWSRRTAVAEWIATWMAVTRQALADAGVVAGLIDNQGRLMIQLEEEDQLLSGNGTPPNLRGLLNTSGVQTLDLTGEDNLDGIRTARRLVKTGLSRLEAEWLVVNPEDSEEIDLLKDMNDQYRGGNPIGNFTFNQTVWKLARVESEALDPGTALVGCKAGATVYERTPLNVLTADQHSDFFIRNLVVVLFEERIAFPVWFPTAFVEITLADWAS